MFILVGFIIAQIVILTVIVVVLKRLIFQDTNSAVNRLTRLDNINREKEKKLSQKLEETDRILREKMEQLAEEEKKMKMEAERAANQLHDDIVKKARDEGEEILKKAYAARAKIRSDAMIEAEGKIMDISVEVLSEVLGPMAAKSLNDQLVRDYLEELEKTDMTLVQNAKKVQLISSSKIDDALMQKVSKLVSEKIGHPIEVTGKEDKSVIAGVVMKFGTMVIDDSLRERLEGAIKKLKSNLSWKHKVQM